MPRRIVKAGRWLITGFDRPHALLAVWTAILFSPIWLALFSPPVMTYDNLPLPVVSEECVQPGCPTPLIRPGEPLTLIIDRTLQGKSDVTYPITRQLRNVETGDVYLLNPAATTASPGTTRSVSRLHNVPTSTPPGRYVMYGTATVPGTIRNYVVNWYTEEFTVL